MHTRHLTRLAASFAAALILFLAAVPTVLGKEGVSVNLLAPLPGDAQPGTEVAVFFTMEAISDDVASPFDGSSVFIRLFGPSGAVTEAGGVEQPTAGTYKAMIEIPAGGVARGEFGIHGRALTASGKEVAVDPVWAYDGLLVSAVVRPPVDPGTFQIRGTKPASDPIAAPADTGTTAPSSSTPATIALDGRLVLGLAAVVALMLAALAGMAIGRARRGRLDGTRI